jgi:broad specificity phosphatase PhoE
MPQPTHQPEAKPSAHATTLYIARHTDVHNPTDILYGRLPRYGLSDLGRQQAERTATTLAEEPISAFYTSPQLRARQTARIIAALHPEAPLHTSSLLAEVRTAWQGRPHSELEEFHFNFYDNPRQESDETLEELWDRINRFVRRVRKRHAGGTVVALTHGDIVFLAKSGFRGMPIEVRSIRSRDFYPGKGSLTRLTFGADLSRRFPLSVEYYDPNSHEAQWNSGWVALDMTGEARVEA